MWHRILPFAMGALIPTTVIAQIGTQKDSTYGVTVAVTPGKLGPEAQVWNFTVVLDTHRQELSDDMVNTAVLLDDRGNEHRPLGWEWDSPVGHHRAGVLKFGAITPRPQTIELRISRSGEAKPRSFRWQLR